MKTNFVILLILLSIFVFAQKKSSAIKTADIKVLGNCDMCKERIEAALDTKGVKAARWDVTSKNLHIVYNASKISELEICGRVAEVGHDTEKVKAKDEVYAKLPFCCLYRDHDHSGMQHKSHHHHGH
jgi:hypothetical protein